MSFKKTDFPKIRADFQNAVADFEKKYNVKVQMGNISFDEYEFSSKVTFTSNEMFSDDVRKKEFAKHAELYGVTAEDFKKQFTVKGKTYEVIGFEIGRPKYPIRVREIATGKETLFVEEVLKMLV